MEHHKLKSHLSLTPLKILLCALPLSLAINMQGSKLVVDKVYYRLDTKTNTATVCSQESNPLLTEAEIQEKVKFEDREFTVVGIEADAFRDCHNLVSVTIPPVITELPAYLFLNCENLKSVSFGDDVKEIGRESFKNCTSLQFINIPEGIVSIGGSAFQDCQSLKSIEIPSTVETLSSHTFAGCTDLQSVTLKEGLKQLSEKVFDGCVSLEEVSLPASLQTTNANTFVNCTGLKKVVLIDSSESLRCKNNGDRNTYYGYRGMFVDSPIEDVYYGRACLIDKYNAGQEGDYGAFRSQDNLKHVVIGPMVKEIPHTSFWQCPSLTTVDIKTANLQIIGSSAFCDCTKLGTFDMPASVETIGNSAFNGCTSLESIVIPAKVNVLSTTVFSGCKNIKNVRIEDSPEALQVPGRGGPLIPTNSIESIHYGRNIEIEPYQGRIYGAFSDAKILKVLTFGDVVTEIGNSDFSSTYSLEYVTLPPNLKKIGDWAFSGSGLKSIKADPMLEEIGAHGLAATKLSELPLVPSLKRVGEYAFSYSHNVETLAIPETLTEIGARAFAHCDNLHTVSTPKTLTQIPEAMFYSCGKLKNLTLSDDITYIGESAFQSCGFTAIKLPSHLEKIGKNAFLTCYELESVSIPDNTREIGYGAFYECHALKDVKFGNSLEIIGDYSFNQCGITDIEFPESLKRIQDGAFDRCYLPNTITIPPSVEYVGSRAFGNGIESLIIEDGSNPIEIQNPVYYDEIQDLYVGRPFTGCFNTTSFINNLTIGNLVSEIPADAFSSVRIGNSYLTLGSGLQQIGENAFKNCNLNYVTVPPFVETIADNAFADNDIYEIDLGYRLNNIGSNAIGKENESMNVKLTAPQPPQTADNAFVNYNGTLYLTAEANHDDFAGTSPWNRFPSLETLEQPSYISQRAYSFELEAGEEIQLDEYIEFDPGYNGIWSIFWQSSNPNIATVDNFGRVKIIESPANVNSYNDCEIRAYTMYENIEPAVFHINRITSEYEEIFNQDILPTSGPLFNLQGVCVKRNATIDDIRNMPVGIYIFNGKKIFNR